MASGEALPLFRALSVRRRTFRPADDLGEVGAEPNGERMTDYQGGVPISGLDVRDGSPAYAHGVGQSLLRDASRQSQPFQFGDDGAGIRLGGSQFQWLVILYLLRLPSTLLE